MTTAIEFYCPRCTRSISLDGPIREAIKTAEAFGWKPDGDQVVCPKCPGSGLGRVGAGK